MKINSYLLSVNVSTPLKVTWQFDGQWTRSEGSVLQRGVDSIICALAELHLKKDRFGNKQKLQLCNRQYSWGRLNLERTENGICTTDWINFVSWCRHLDWHFEG